VTTRQRTAGKGKKTSEQKKKGPGKKQNDKTAKVQTLGRKGIMIMPLKTGRPGRSAKATKKGDALQRSGGQETERKKRNNEKRGKKKVMLATELRKKNKELRNRAWFRERGTRLRTLKKSSKLGTRDSLSSQSNNWAKETTKIGNGGGKSLLET